MRRNMPWWNHPQEKSLRPLTEEVTSAQQVVIKNIVHSRQPSSNTLPIRIWAYAGETDAIVEPVSAKFVFDDRYCGTLPGDHFTIIQPNEHKHRSYVALKNRTIEALRGADIEAEPELGRYAVSSPSEISEAVTRMRLTWRLDRHLRHFGTPEFTELRRAIDRRNVINELSSDDRCWLVTAAIYDGFLPGSTLPLPDDAIILDAGAYWLRRRSPRGPRYRSAILLERSTQPQRGEVARRALDDSGMDKTAILADAIANGEVIKVLEDPRLSPDLKPDDQNDRQQRKYLVEFWEWVREIDRIG